VTHLLGWQEESEVKCLINQLALNSGITLVFLAMVSIALPGIAENPLMVNSAIFEAASFTMSRNGWEEQDECKALAKYLADASAPLLVILGVLAWPLPSLAMSGFTVTGVVFLAVGSATREGGWQQEDMHHLFYFCSVLAENFGIAFVMLGIFSWLLPSLIITVVALLGYGLIMVHLTLREIGLHEDETWAPVSEAALCCGAFCLLYAALDLALPGFITYTLALSCLLVVGVGFYRIGLFDDE